MLTERKLHAGECNKRCPNQQKGGILISLYIVTQHTMYAVIYFPRQHHSMEEEEKRHSLRELSPISTRLGLSFYALLHQNQ